MKHVTLLTCALAFSALANAQTNSELSGNRPNGTKTGYVFEFNGTAAYNCPSQIPSEDYYINPNYTLNSIGSGTLSVSTNGDQESYHRINLKFTEGDCSPVTIDLSNAANQKIEIKLTSSVAVPQMMVQLSDNMGQFADNNPPFHDLVVGENTIVFNSLDFAMYGDPSPGNIDATKIQHISLFFRNSYDDNTSPATTPSVTGTFDIDYIHIGDVSDIVTSSQAAVESSLKYFPNPASDWLSIRYDYNGASKVLLSDLNGKTVKSMETTSGNDGLKINTEDILSGIYLLSIVTDQGVVSKKVVIAHK